MDALTQHRKMPGKDFGSLLIVLGYVIIIVVTINVILDWISRSAVPEPIGELSASSQGFVPYLDPSRSLSSEGEGRISVFGHVYSSVSPAQLASVASWERDALDEQNAGNAISTEGLERSALERWIPEYLAIPAIDLDVPISVADYEEVEILGETYRQWLAPDFRAAGWQPGSAALGVPGNTVLIGHHNVYGEVFRNLEKLEIGDRITVYSGERSLEYRVGLKMILPEKYESLETRIENARWLQSTQDERLTLVTCWPYENNSNRLILVAEPVVRGSDGIGENRYDDP